MRGKGLQPPRPPTAAFSSPSLPPQRLVGRGRGAVAPPSGPREGLAAASLTSPDYSWRQATSPPPTRSAPVSYGLVPGLPGNGPSTRRRRVVGGRPGVGRGSWGLTGREARARPASSSASATPGCRNNQVPGQGRGAGACGPRRRESPTVPPPRRRGSTAGRTPTCRAASPTRRGRPRRASPTGRHGGRASGTPAAAEPGRRRGPQARRVSRPPAAPGPAASRGGAQGLGGPADALAALPAPPPVASGPAGTGSGSGGRRRA